MKRYFNKNNNSYNNYCDDIDSSFMVEIPDDGKPYGLIDNQLVDISSTEAYKAKVTEDAKQIKLAELNSQISELDLKSIRALREGGIYDSSTGQTYIEYYTSQIVELRKQIASL